MGACSSVDRALGCGPKGRGFEPLQARPGTHEHCTAKRKASLQVAGFFQPGEVSERLKELVSKTSEGVRALRGFESHPLRPDDGRLQDYSRS
jgi:hypothetical protein